MEIVNVEEMFGESQRAEEVLRRLPVGVLFDLIDEELGRDRKATSGELLRVADVGRRLLYGALGHRDADEKVLAQARERWGRMADVARSMSRGGRWTLFPDRRPEPR